MIVKSFHETEQIAARCTLVTYNRRSQTGAGKGSAKVSCRNIGRDAHLPGLEHDRANLTGLCLLLFQAPMQFRLSIVEHEGDERPSLGANAKQLRRIESE